jgi:adenylate cyclase
MAFFFSSSSFSWTVVFINVGANVAGFFLVQVLLRYAQPQIVWEEIQSISAKYVLGILAFLIPVAVFILHRLAAPVDNALKSMSANSSIPPDQLEIARQRAVNLPFMAAMMNLVAWIIPAAAFPVVFGLHKIMPLTQVAIYMLYNFTNGLMITLLAFVILEYACSRTAVPVLFPNGLIHDQGGTISLSIRSRLMIMYVAICLIPMFQTALITNSGATFAFQLEDPCETLRNLGTFSLILFFFTGVYGVWLALLFSRNLSEPAEEIIKVADRVRAGDYDSYVHVVTNDEIGYLGDRVNEMTKGLKERERIREVFNLFTSPEISSEVLSGKVSSGGEIRRVTLLFSDLRGFTSMAEKLPPKKVMESINAYFREMSAAVVDHGGIVLQYVGDEIEAVFGAPMDDPDHADKAVETALEMRARLKKLNEERAADGEAPLTHGIGIHTGLALAGIVGSRHKISYAMVGDTVNVASRIQELNKNLNTDILVSSETYRSLRGNRNFSDPLTVKVKGKTQSVDVYELIG